MRDTQELVKDRQDLSKLENMEKSKKRHGEHFIALALHTMYHAMLSPLDSPSSAFSGMEQNGLPFNNSTKPQPHSSNG